MSPLMVCMTVQADQLFVSFVSPQECILPQGIEGKGSFLHLKLLTSHFLL